jgi:uncharacterized repeat protein (TIGR03803 family)
MKNHVRFDLGRALAAAAILATACPAHAQVTETVLYAFTGGKDGASPEATLLADTAGPNHALRGLYGTAAVGGGAGCSPFDGCGTLFELTPPKNGHASWTDRTKWRFTGGADGSNPATAGLSAATRRISRNTPLYGTTFLGGSGNGTVFASTGTNLTNLWTFTGGSDGANPLIGQVVIDGTGNVYAAASDGGASGNGTVIELTPPAEGQSAWTEATIWSFSGSNDGAFPSGLLIDKEGALYVTAAGGGSTGNGAIVKLIPPAQGQAAWTEQTLWSFQGGNDASTPQGPVTMGKNGTLYGTTFYGGSNQIGTVYRLIPPRQGKTSWREEVLWTFTGGNDGCQPFNAVILDRNGGVYGTAAACGSAQGYGAAFKLMPPAHGQSTWSETTLWDFSGGSDGGNPLAALTADKSGILYGATATGGSLTDCSDYGCGVVFSLTGTGYVP